MAGIFYVGEEPSTPLVITVRNEDGTIHNLSSYTSVTIAGTGLPAGTASVADATGGRVQYEFDDPFVNAGVFELRIVMTTADGDVDFGTPLEITVRDPADATTMMLSITEVEGITGISVSYADLLQAQGIIMLSVGRDLTDADWVATISTQDFFWLRMAIAYQAAETRTNASSGSFELPRVAGASTITNGDVTVSFSNSRSGGEVDLLSNQARVALLRLSWMRTMRSVQAKPFLGRSCATAEPLGYRLVPIHRTFL